MTPSLAQLGHFPFLEDKNLYVFDEWAADQDPMFKEFFYHEILPSLKKKIRRWS